MEASPSERPKKKKNRLQNLYVGLGLDLTGELGDPVWELHGP